MPPTLAVLDERTEQHGRELDDLNERGRAADVQIAKNAEQIDNVVKALKEFRDAQDATRSLVEAVRGDVALVRLQMPRGWTLTIPEGSGRVVGLVIGGIMAGLLTGGVGGAGRDIALEVVREVVGVEAPRQPVAVPVPVPMPVPMPPANP